MLGGPERVHPAHAPPHARALLLPADPSLVWTVAILLPIGVLVNHLKRTCRFDLDPALLQRGAVTPLPAAAVAALQPLAAPPGLALLGRVAVAGSPGRLLQAEWLRGSGGGGRNKMGRRCEGLATPLLFVCCGGTAGVDVMRLQGFFCSLAPR